MIDLARLTRRQGAGSLHPAADFGHTNYILVRMDHAAA